MKSRDRYRDAGVDIELADELVNRHFGTAINAGESSRIQDDLLGSVASFGALSRGAWSEMSFPREDEHARWRMVMTSDGVGSKVLLATDAAHHRAIAQDCVAMCTNDLRAMGASPMWMMDYFGCNRLNEEMFAAVAEGLQQATQQEGCVLMGGETAEMPGFHAHEQYELVGFAVGRVRVGEEWTRRAHQGDLVIALGSSGLHSNGFSLVRRAIDEGVLSLDEVLGDGRTVLAHLMEPTTLYGASLDALWQAGLKRSVVKRAAHVTGGGLERARRRLCGEDALAVKIEDQGAEPMICTHLRKVLGLGREDAEGIWNMGAGFLMILDQQKIKREELLQLLTLCVTPCWLYGEIVQAA